MNRKTLLAAGLTVAAIVGSAYLTLGKNSGTTVKDADVQTTTFVAETNTNTIPNLDEIKKVQRLNTQNSQIMLLNAEVTNQSVEILIEQLEHSAKTESSVYLILDSPGGSVFDGARLIAYMEGSPIPVYTVCYSICASMAAQIHQHGKKRYMVDHSTLMFHSAAGGVRGTVPEMRSLLDYIELSVNKLDAYVAKRSSMDYNSFKLLTLKNLWIDAEDSVNMGLADGIVTVNFPRNAQSIFNLGEELKKRGIVTPPTVTNAPQLDVK